VAKRLVLSRDRLGICPLHICEHAGHLIFASEVKAIFAANADIRGLSMLSAFRRPSPFWSIAPQGVFQGVSEPRTGSRAALVNGTVRDHAY
jgi:asparagine synthase (glutamine-hydrolysing)